jgi:hypothetical protein
MVPHYKKEEKHEVLPLWAYRRRSQNDRNCNLGLR